MKRFHKFLLPLALCLAGVASAGTVSVTGTYTNGVKVMVVPPAFALSALPQSRAAGETVRQGELRSQGSEVIAAAVSGVTSSALVTNYTYSQSGSVVTTNLVTRPARVDVPSSGLSAADGTVLWMRAPRSREGLTVYVKTGTMDAGGYVVLSDGGGGAIPVYADTRFDASAFLGYKGALYATKYTTNAVTVAEQGW